MWRRYPDVKLKTCWGDTAAMRLVSNPAEFDVLVTEKCSAIFSPMRLPSFWLDGAASVCLTGQRTDPVSIEPIHGSAPDIAGKGIANPIGTYFDVRHFAALFIEIGKRGICHRNGCRKNHCFWPVDGCLGGLPTRLR
jgi:isocitrate/isopropylmalate dehydrogenase